MCSADCLTSVGYEEDGVSSFASRRIPSGIQEVCSISSCHLHLASYRNSEYSTTVIMNLPPNSLTGVPGSNLDGTPWLKTPRIENSSPGESYSKVVGVLQACAEITPLIILHNIHYAKYIKGMRLGMALHYAVIDNHQGIAS